MESNIVLKFTIEYEVASQYASTIGAVMDKMREYGEADIVDVEKIVKKK